MNEAWIFDKIEEKKKKGNFWLKKNQRTQTKWKAKRQQKRAKKTEKRGEIKRIAPQWIKQLLCKNKQYKEKEQKNI